MKGHACHDRVKECRELKKCMRGMLVVIECRIVGS